MIQKKLCSVFGLKHRNIGTLDVLKKKKPWSFGMCPTSVFLILFKKKACFAKLQFPPAEVFLCLSGTDRQQETQCVCTVRECCFSPDRPSEGGVKYMEK